jgi:hypothetical protein
MPQWTRRRTITVLLSPVGLLIISAVRLLVVGDYNTTTAQAIASSSGYVNTLLGTIMPLVPIVLPYLTVLFLIYRRLLLSALSFGAAVFVSPTKLAPITSDLAFRHAVDGYWKWTQARPSVVATTFAALLVFGLFVTKEVWSNFRADVVRSVHRSGKSIQEAAVDHGVAEATLRSWLRGGSGGAAASLVLAVVASAFLLPYFWYIYPVPRTLSYYKVLVAQPWLPSERIEAGSGPPIVGYVLSASDTWVTVLDARTRTIRYFPAAKVTGRLVCRLGSEAVTSLNSSALIPLFKVKGSQLPACLGPGSARNLIQAPSATSEWTISHETTSSSDFEPVRDLRPLNLCTSGRVTATLSVELTGNPAGFRINMDRGRIMEPGPVRFVPVGLHDSFSFTFTGELGPLRTGEHHTFAVEWRSPTHAATTLERATFVLQPQPGTASC